MPPWIFVAAACLIVVIYAYPGYLNWDSGEQLFQSRVHPRDDWHPPIMAAYWHPLDMVMRGPFLMLLLQTGLFGWGIYAAYQLRLPRRTAAIAAALTIVFPPVLTPMTVVWKDAQMAAFLLAGTMLALRGSWRARCGGVVMIFIGAALRDNALFAVPPLALLLVAHWRVRRRLLAAIGLTFVIASASHLANSALTDKRAYPWYRSVAMHDLAGTICNEGPLTDDEVRAQLAGIPTYVDHDLQTAICRQYTPRSWFALSFGAGSVFRSKPGKADRVARGHAWLRIVREHPGAWLAHRWAVMREVLGLTPSDPWEPVCQTVEANVDRRAKLHHDAALSWIQKCLGRWFSQTWGTTVFYRPWAYALGCLLLLVVAARRRDGWLAALMGTGLLYEASYFIGAAAPDFRYSHWLVTCCTIGVIVVFLERLRCARPVATDPASM